MEQINKRYFLTVDWCNKGNRGVFCEGGGCPYSKETAHTDHEMAEILGSFWLILSPKSLPYSQEELKKFNRFVPLAEYSNQYGVALKGDQK